MANQDIAGLGSCESLSGLEDNRLERLFSDIPAAVVVLSGPDHIFRFANEGYEELVGRSRRFMGLPIAQVLPEMAEQGFIALLDNVYSTGEPFFGQEMPVAVDRRSDGHLDQAYFNFAYLPAHNTQGEIDGIFVHAVDVTDLVRARVSAEELTRELDLERARLETIIEHIPAGVVIADPSGSITQANSVWGDFFEVHLDDVNDVSSWKVFDGCRPDGSSYAADEYPLARTVLCGETVLGEQIQFRSGDAVRKTIEVSSAPILDESGDIVSGVAIFSEITERLALQGELVSQRALEHAQVRIDQVLDAAGDGIWVLDSKGRTTLLNPAAQQMTGYSPQEVLGEVSHGLVHHSYVDGSPYPIESCPVYRSVFHGEQCHVDNEVFWRKDGTSFPVSYRSTPIFDGDEQIGAVQVFQDLTEQRKIETARRREEEAEVSQQQALQLNDDILQGLTITKLAFELGDTDRALHSLDRTISSMKVIINGLLSAAQDDPQLHSGSLVRTVPAGFGGEGGDEVSDNE